MERIFKIIYGYIKCIIYLFSSNRFLNERIYIIRNLSNNKILIIGSCKGNTFTEDFKITHIFYAKKKK